MLAKESKRRVTTAVIFLGTSQGFSLEMSLGFDPCHWLSLGIYMDLSCCVTANRMFIGRLVLQL